jgi:hypothetical protein
MLSRRAAIAAAATLPIAAAPAASVADVYVEISWSDIVERLELTVRTLRHRFVAEAFKLDEAAAAAALAYVRGRADGESMDDGADRRFIGFLVNHGQPLGWVIAGDVGSLMCLCAAYDYGRDRLAHRADPDTDDEDAA